MARAGADIGREKSVAISKISIVIPGPAVAQRRPEPGIHLRAPNPSLDSGFAPPGRAQSAPGGAPRNDESHFLPGSASTRMNAMRQGLSVRFDQA